MTVDGHDPLLSGLSLEAQRAGARRIVFDGTLWAVYERAPSAFDRRRSPSLIFESTETIRRVRSFPANWRELSDSALAQLSWGR